MVNTHNSSQNIFLHVHAHLFTHCTCPVRGGFGVLLYILWEQSGGREGSWVRE
jgi:hypothetical protein